MHRPSGGKLDRRVPSGRARDAAREPGDTVVRAALSVALLGAWLAAQAGPSNWLWGMNLLRYYGPGFGFVLTAVGLAAVWLLPRVQPDGRTASRLAAAPPIAMALALGGAATLLFHLFRTESFLLGDGLEIIRRLHQGEVPAPRSPLYNTLAPPLFRAFSGGDLGRAALAAGTLSFVAGFVGVTGAAWHLARVARRDAPGALAALAYILLCGALQLFFGYVEVYALPAAATLLFFGAAFDRLTGGGRAPLVTASIGLGMGVLSHPFAITLLPAWIALFFVRRDGTWVLPDARTRLGVFLLAGGVTAALSVLFALWPEGRAPGAPLRYLAPQVYIDGLLSSFESLGRARPWADRYRSTSLVHAADSWNSAFLAGGAALVVVLFLLVPRSTRALARRPVVAVPLLAMAGLVGFRFLFRTPLGAVRDWDLFAGLGFGAAAIAGGFALAGAGRRLAPAVAAAGLTLLVPWIGVQLDKDRAARRHFESIDAEPRPEPAVAAMAHGAMGDRFAALGNLELAERAYRRSLDLYPRYEYAWRLGMSLYARRDFAASVAALEDALALRPDDRVTLVSLGEVLVSGGQPVRADSVLARARTLYPDDGAAWLQTARARLAEGDRAAARAALAEADRRMRPDDALRPDFERVAAALDAGPPSP
jgi:Flp pilus assembly protein TadD